MLYILISTFTLKIATFSHIFQSRAFTLILIVLFLSHGVTIKPKSIKKFSITNICSNHKNQIRISRNDEE